MARAAATTAGRPLADTVDPVRASSSSASLALPLRFSTQDSALVDSPTAAPAPLTRELSQSTLIARQFDELLAEPISAQHQEHFHHYFKSNVRTKTFTVEEFSHLFQVAPLLGMHAYLETRSDHATDCVT